MESISFDEYIRPIQLQSKKSNGNQLASAAPKVFHPPSATIVSEDNRNTDEPTLRDTELLKDEKRDKVDLSRKNTSVDHVLFLYELSRDRQQEGKRIREMIASGKKDAGESVPNVSKSTSNDSLSKTSKKKVCVSRRILDLYEQSSARQEEGKKLRDSIQEKLAKKDLATFEEQKNLKIAQSANDRMLELYSRSFSRQKEGKEKRDSVEKKIANRHYVRTEYSTLPPSRNGHLYELSTIFIAKRDLKLEEIRKNLHCSVA